MMGTESYLCHGFSTQGSYCNVYIIHTFIHTYINMYIYDRNIHGVWTSVMTQTAGVQNYGRHVYMEYICRRRAYGC